MVNQTPITNETSPTKSLTHATPSKTANHARDGNIKLKGIWRETQLAQPKMPQGKYVPPYNGPLKLIQKSLIIDTEILQRCNNLAFVQLRTLSSNKREFKDILSKRFLTNIERQEEKTNNIMYYDYRKYTKMNEENKLRLLQRRQKPKKKKKKDEETEEQRAERIQKLATPKKLFEAPIPDRGPIGNLREMTRLIDLAEPVKREDYLPPKEYQPVSEAAKHYVASDIIHKLAQHPKRFLLIEPPIECVRPVPQSALTYKITPEILKLYTVKVRKEGGAAVPEEEIWKISPGALKYVATPRILQLAKPIERK